MDKGYSYGLRLALQTAHIDSLEAENRSLRAAYKAAQAEAALYAKQLQALATDVTARDSQRRCVQELREAQRSVDDPVAQTPRCRNTTYITALRAGAEGGAQRSGAWCARGCREHGKGTARAGSCNAAAGATGPAALPFGPLPVSTVPVGHSPV